MWPIKVSLIAEIVKKCSLVELRDTITILIPTGDQDAMVHLTQFF